MSLCIYHDLSFWNSLFIIDKEIAKKFQTENTCERCSGSLNFDNYKRKPRGLPKEAEEFFSIRFSFTCADCKKRATPPSVRFLGRKIYVGVIVLLISSSNPASDKLSEILSKSLSKITIKRWEFWWDILPMSSIWKKQQGVIAPNVQKKRLPDFLIELFTKVKYSLQDTCLQLLTFIAPIAAPLNYVTTVQIIP